MGYWCDLFFFQAEDGIRDIGVTGVQTCALPISELSRKAAREHARTPWREEVWEQLAADITFVQGSFDDDNAFDHLAATLGELEGSHGIGGNAAFYLSIPPAMFPTVLKQMQRTGMAESTPERWRWVVVEKPFGEDLPSSRELNALVDSV